MNHVIEFYKESQKSLRPEIMKQQLAYSIQRALASGRGKVWSINPPQIKVDRSNDILLYSARLTVNRIGKKVSEETQQKQLETLQQMAASAILSKGWFLKNAPKENKKDIVPEQTYADVEINTDTTGFFSHLYGLDPQIELVCSSLNEYIRSNYNNRFHACLFGAPASGKTEILRSLTRMVGNDAVLHFDATSTTSAGAKQLLIESEYTPPILCIEEIEKADEVSLRWLLGVLDYRSEVRQLKFRSGLRVKEVKLLCLATVNDFGLFNKMMDGALASRFSHKIHCPRPSRETLTKILEREIVKHQGNMDWIEPTLDYCIDEEKTNDPRRIITVCLCGREKLLTGEYQKVLNSTRYIERIE